MSNDRFGVVVAALMAEKGWTAYRLAKEAGIPEQTVRSILAGAAPRVDTLEKLLSAAGVDWKWFAGRIEFPPGSDVPPAVEPGKPKVKKK